MDYGLIQLDENTKIHLYGTPGQERFDFMWDILSQGSMGLILLLDNTRGNPLKRFEILFGFFCRFAENRPLGGWCNQNGYSRRARY